MEITQPVLDEVQLTFNEAADRFDQMRTALFSGTTDSDEVIVNICTLKVRSDPDLWLVLTAKLRDNHARCMRIIKSYSTPEQNIETSEPMRLLRDLDAAARLDNRDKIKEILDQFLAIQTELVRAAAQFPAIGTRIRLLMFCAGMFDFARMKVYLGLMSSIRPKR